MAEVNIEVVQEDEEPAEGQKEKLAKFLHTHLEEYGDEQEDIRKSIDYVFTPGRGGFIAVAKVDDKLAGVVILNKTGMAGYIPEYILVYIAVDKEFRGKGIGKKLIHRVQDEAEGDIALHVEKDNPARFLYEKSGFTTPYLEMRWKKK